MTQINYDRCKLYAEVLGIPWLWEDENNAQFRMKEEDDWKERGLTHEQIEEFVMGLADIKIRGILFPAAAEKLIKQARWIVKKRKVA